MWSDLANVILAAIALILLFQGQRDRESERISSKRDQASKVSIAVIDNDVPAGEDTYVRESRTIRVRNDSDLPVTYSGFVELRSRLSAEQYKAQSGYVGVERIQPVYTHETSLRPHEEREFRDTQHEWDSAVFSFADSDGRHWVRLSDTGELHPVFFVLPRRSRIYQTLAQLPVLRLLLIRWPEKYANWRAYRTNKVPLSARIIRFWWGHVPIGEPDSWDMPEGWPSRDWPYEQLLGDVRLRRSREQTAETAR